MNEAEKRAAMPNGANAVLSRRTVHTDNANLLTLVKKGDVVLDVGCGSGEITKGIAELVGDRGFVQGIDTSAHLIGLAKQNYHGISNLAFDLADINSYTPGKKFNVVTSARVLQWLSNREEVLSRMKDLLLEGGCLTILDYNHEKVEFEPALPGSMRTFYDNFLKWRKDSGMDNQVADHLEQLFVTMGLRNISVVDRSETTHPGKPSFREELSIWQKVAELRGPQLVNDSYITEKERLLAIQDYAAWMDKAKKMKLSLKSVTGYL